MAKNLPRSAQVLPTIGYEVIPYSRITGIAGYYWGQTPENGIQCPECYSVLDWNPVSRHVTVKARKDVVSADGRPIVTPRFREFCIANGYENIVFHRVGKRRELYEMRPTCTLEVDLERSQPLLTDFCRRCGNFECYLEGAGLFLEGLGQPLEDGFYRTDLIRGCRAGKHPIIIVAEATMMKIKSAKFTGVTFRPVPYVDPDFETRKALNRDSHEN